MVSILIRHYSEVWKALVGVAGRVPGGMVWEVEGDLLLLKTYRDFVVISISLC